MSEDGNLKTNYLWLFYEDSVNIEKEARSLVYTYAIGNDNDY